MPLPNQQSINYRLTHANLFSYVEAASNLYGATQSIIVPLPTGTTAKVLVSPAVLFPAFTTGPFLISLLDQTLNSAYGFNVYGSNADTVGFPVAPNAPFSFKAVNLTPFYIAQFLTTNPAMQILLAVSGS